MDTTRNNPLSRLAVAAVASAGIVTALAGCATGTSDAGQTADPGTSTPSSGTASSAPGTDGTSSTGGSYTDGTYEAEGSYQSPGGQESVKVSLTLQGDVVTAVTVTPEATSGNSKQYQTRFASGISDVVVGKNIDDLKVDKVSGSSLTSGGFNAALETIKSEAAS